jgi:dienelactone hydrolase
MRPPDGARRVAPRRLARIITGMIIGAALVPACSSAPSSARPHASVTVQPGTSDADQAVQIRVAGLDAGELVTVQVTSTDAAGTKWASSARYHASASGTIDPAQAAPVSGSYQGVSAMGPVWSMQASGPVPLTGYDWGSPSGEFRFTVTVTAGGTEVASTSFQRKISGIELISQRESLQANGLVGEFISPAPTAVRRPAILLLGGSEGGLPGSLLAATLASHDYPVLGVAYFGEPGLPATLSRIPLEYFAKALRWLAGQPGVNPAKIAVLGISRGSEAAQLLGVHYPGLVHAVIASVPSDAAICSFPGCKGPAWTLNGRALPFTFQFDNPSPTDNPAAVFPDQQIQGPVFLDCAEADQTWSSCPYARAILSRLDMDHDRWTHVLYGYPGAGHSIGSFGPYEPWGPAALAQMGSAVAADEAATPPLWQHLISFLAAFAASSGS